MNTNSTFEGLNRRPDLWKYLILGLLISSGVLLMAAYKINSLPGETGWFWGLVIFAEAAAGLLVFSQAILRRIDEIEADRMFSWSIVFRLMIAGIGWVVYDESETMSLSGFLTYELANGLMIFVELMFAKILAHQEIDFQSLSKQINEAFEKEKAEHKKTIKKLEKSQGDLRVEKSLKDQNQEQCRETLERASSLEDALASIARGKKIPQASRGLLEPDTLGGIEKTLEAVSVINSLKGRTWTAGKSTHGWICPECFSYNEANYSKPKTCTNCNHTLS